jgi:hypothetical protein
MALSIYPASPNPSRGLTWTVDAVVRDGLANHARSCSWREMLGRAPGQVNRDWPHMSKLDRNVPCLTSLETSPFLFFGFVVCSSLAWPAAIVMLPWRPSHTVTLPSAGAYGRLPSWKNRFSYRTTQSSLIVRSLSTRKIRSNSVARGARR